MPDSNASPTLMSTLRNFVKMQLLIQRVLGGVADPALLNKLREHASGTGLRTSSG